MGRWLVSALLALALSGVVWVAVFGLIRKPDIVQCECFLDLLSLRTSPARLLSAPYPDECSGNALVVVEVSVLAAGRVDEARVVQSDDRCFNEAALAAARAQRFPTSLDEEMRLVRLPFYFDRRQRMVASMDKSRYASSAKRGT